MRNGRVGGEVRPQIEFYLTASMMWSELKRADQADVTALRRAVLAAYLGDDRRIGSDLAHVSLNRIAGSLVKRAIPSFIPLAGIPLAGMSAHRTQKQARAAIAKEIAARSKP